MPRAKFMALHVVTPILSPVNDPGPILREIASRFLRLNLLFLSTISIAGIIREECRSSPLSQKEAFIVSPSRRATFKNFVDVSMPNIFIVPLTVIARPVTPPSLRGRKAPEAPSHASYDGIPPYGSNCGTISSL